MNMQCNATEQKERSTEKSKKEAVAVTVIVTIRQTKKIPSCIIFYTCINYKFESRMNSWNKE